MYYDNMDSAENTSCIVYVQCELYVTLDWGYLWKYLTMSLYRS